MLKTNISKYISIKSLLFVFLLATVFVTVQRFSIGDKTFGADTHIYTHYNNYVIFKQSFYHLLDNKDLYKAYPDEQFDLFKYTPTFAMLMAPMALLNDYLGLFIWNLLNVMVLFWALVYFPFKERKYSYFALLFIFIELINGLQNTQSNGLIAGLIIASFVLIERRKIALATFLLILSVFIKPFGIVACSLFLCYPDKIKTILYATFWFILLLFLPLIVISADQLILQYNSWLNLLQNDHSKSVGLSMMGWLASWFNIYWDKLFILSNAMVLFLVGLLRYRLYEQKKYRQLLLASILLWVIVFNHKSESPTFIIAVSGIIIWFFNVKQSVLNKLFLLLAFIFTILLPTGMFDFLISQQILNTYVIKAVPCILIWFKITFDILSMKRPKLA